MTEKNIVVTSGRPMNPGGGGGGGGGMGMGSWLSGYTYAHISGPYIVMNLMPENALWLHMRKAFRLYRKP